MLFRKEAWRYSHQEPKELKKTAKAQRGRGALKDKDSIAVHKAEEKALEIKRFRLRIRESTGTPDQQAGIAAG